MAFTPAPGQPNWSGTFIPEVWSGMMLEHLYAETVFASICNTDYEGDIRNFGDKVKIRLDPVITSQRWVPGGKLQTQRPETSVIELHIDKALAWQVGVDTVYMQQSDVASIDRFTKSAARNQKIDMERELLASVVPDFHAKNKGTTAGVLDSSLNLGTTGSPLVVTSTNVIDVIIDANEALAQQNVPPSEEKFLVIPQWFANKIKKSDLKDASLSGDGTSMLRNGRIGRVDDLTLYITNNYTAVVDGGNPCYNIIGGHKMGLTFASQFVTTETAPAPDTFGQLVRGLQVYGFKVVKPEALVAVYCRKGA